MNPKESFKLCKSRKYGIKFERILFVCFYLESIKIILDCRTINEDTLIGLELQHLTPFRFHFHKLWINNHFRQILAPQISFDINLILNLTNTNVITS